MKAQKEHNKEQKPAVVQAKSESGTGGTANIEDKRPFTVHQRKLRETMNSSAVSKKEPVQRKAPKGSSRFQQIAMDMGEQHGVDTSGLVATHNSSFPEKLNAEATIQGRNIHFAPGMDTDYNIRHEVAHAIDNTLNGTPKGDQVVNGQKIDTTREQVADRMAGGLSTVRQLKSYNTPTQTNTPPIQLNSKLTSWDHLDISRFTNKIQFLKSLPEFKTEPAEGVVYDSIPYATIIDGERGEIVQAFESYLTGHESDDDYIKALTKALKPHLDLIFGDDDLNVIRKRYKLDRGWASKRRESGKKVGLRIWTQGVPKHKALGYKRLKADMKKQFIAQPDTLTRTEKYERKLAATNYFDTAYEEWLSSGRGRPISRQFPANTTFYKIMGAGKSFQESRSPYYLDEATYRSLKNTDSFMDLLGLPILNYEAVYVVYKIKSLGDVTVYQSRVAATKQTAGSKESRILRWENRGSLLQTIIIDSHNTDLWEKHSTPIEIIDPDEKSLNLILEEKTSQN